MSEELQVLELLTALKNIKRLLDGADNWSPHDVLANANCAYSVAEDALAAYADRTAT